MSCRRQPARRMQSTQHIPAHEQCSTTGMYHLTSLTRYTCCDRCSAPHIPAHDPQLRLHTCLCGTLRGLHTQPEQNHHITWAPTSVHEWLSHTSHLQVVSSSSTLLSYCCCCRFLLLLLPGWSLTWCHPHHHAICRVYGGTCRHAHLQRNSSREQCNQPSAEESGSCAMEPPEDTSPS
jgi:hypothetical protein